MLIALLPLLVLAFLPAVLLGDDGVLVYLGAAAVLVPAVFGAVLHFRNKRLVSRGGGLVYVDWLGRSRLIPRDDVAQVLFVKVRQLLEAAGPEARMVVVRRSGAAPLAVGVSMWDGAAVRRLLADVGVPQAQVKVVGKPVSPAQLGRWVPGLRLPYREHRLFLLVHAAVGVAVVVHFIVAWLAG